MIKKFQKNRFSEICAQLQIGQIFILPTDTIYGFSGDPENPAAIQNIQIIKKRPEKKPFLLLIPSIKSASELVEFPGKTLEFLEKIWPGPFTILLPRKKNALPNFFPKETRLALRIPGYPLLLDFLQNYWKKPLISTSANISGEEMENSIQKLEDQFKNQDISIYIDKINDIAKPSTLISIEDEKLIILRKGLISKNQIIKIAREFFKI